MTALILCLALGQGLDVLAHTRDGEKIEGIFVPRQKDFLDPYIEIRTAPDQIFNMAWAGMESIRFGDPDVVKHRWSGEVEGEVLIATFRIRTPWGRRTLKKGDLTALEIRDSSVERGPANFEGTWQTTFGPMKLEQKGESVKGRYGYSNDRTLEGRVDGRDLDYRYSAPSGNGEGTFEMQDDNLSFLGEYLHEGAETTGFWGGYQAGHREAVVRPGDISTGISESRLRYHIRVPEGYDGKKKYPAILILHGSNMDSFSYIETIESEWSDLARDYILIGVDGERISRNSTREFPRSNYTYVSWVGKRSTWTGTREHESPPFIADTVKELQKTYPIGKLFVGGHSQGGYLTYTLFMHYPELFAGAFPIASGLIFQAEPSVFEDVEIRRAQRDAPLAIIHARDDPVVGFGSSEWAHHAFEEGGFPMLRLFDPPEAGHGFMNLPVPKAIRWLGSMASDDAERLAAFSEESFEGKRYRDAVASLRKASSLNPGRAVRSRLSKLRKAIEKLADPPATKLEKRMASSKGGEWMDDFLAFRGDFAFADASSKCMQIYSRLKEKHRKPADELIRKSRQEKDEETRRALWKEVLEKYFATKWYPFVKKWLE
ncbi:MAG: alpha/beta hydrolase-fold protein [Planctomycetota bacterium]|nr:alpha/beta hydrolase-fold protein [Planctomycetota bacterium]